MTRLALSGGAYETRSVIAAAQKCMNLYAESLPTGNKYTGSSGIEEPAQFAYYPTPGLRRLNTLPQNGVRAIKQATTGGIYAVAGSGVYRIDPSTWAGTLLGSVTTGHRTPVSMQDNGLMMAIVDGSPYGWSIDLTNDTFAQIADPTGMFSGADVVQYLDTYLLFNKPKTPQFYSSDSLSLKFDPLWFANKQSFSDLLVTLAVAKREIWLLGDRTSEVWYNSGKPDFTFEEQPGTFVDHGCCAKYSAAVYDNSVFWLSRDRQGRGFVIQGAGYQTKRISTHAIEQELAGYETLNDAIGFCYGIAGHAFYVLTFPKADRTWVYDIVTGLWHEWAWIDSNGDEHRHRANCCYPVNDTIVVGDWQNGNLYALDRNVYTDDGQPIKRVRAFPHILNDGNRVFYRQFVADIDTGTGGGEVIEQTLLRTTFTASDNTLLQDYVFDADVGLPWTVVSGTAHIVNNQLFGPTGAAEYRATALMAGPDYVLTFKAIPTDYGTVPESVDVYAVARSGYKVTISADGAQYWVQLAVIGGVSTSIAMGTIPSGHYAVTLRLQGETITLSVQRTSDSLWLRGDGVWATSASNAITVNDDTHPAPGQVSIGGTW